VEILIALMIAGGVTKAVSGIISRANQREQSIAEAKYQASVADINQAQQATDLQNTLKQMDQGLGVQMGDDYSKAGSVQSQTKAGFTGAMADTYMGQLGQEAGLVDLKQQNLEASGQISASAGASGLRDNLTMQSVVDSQIREKETFARSQIDQGLSNSVYKAGNQANASMDEANKLLTAYQPGSAYMSAFSFKQQAMKTQGAYSTALYTKKRTYLEKIVLDNQYNWNWFAADAFGVLGAAADTGTSLYSAGAFK
jgi:hypothetical protein